MRADIDCLPPFFRVDLRVARTWVFSAFTLEAWLDVSGSGEVLGFDYTRDRVTGELVNLPTTVPVPGAQGAVLRAHGGR